MPVRECYHETLSLFPRPTAFARTCMKEKRENFESNFFNSRAGLKSSSENKILSMKELLNEAMMRSGFSLRRGDFSFTILEFSTRTNVSIIKIKYFQHLRDQKKKKRKTGHSRREGSSIKSFCGCVTEVELIERYSLVRRLRKAYAFPLLKCLLITFQNYKKNETIL